MGGQTSLPTVSLTSIIVYEYVAGTMVVTLGTAVRSNARCAGRPLEGLPHGQHVALRPTRSPSRTCGSGQAGDHGGPRRGVPLPHHAGMEAHPVGAQGRSNGTIAPVCLVLRGAQGGALCASSRGPLQTG